MRLVFDPEGHNLQAAGMTLDLNGGSAMQLFLSLGVAIAEEAALHMVFMCKGSGGLKPCIFVPEHLQREGDSCLRREGQ